MRLLIDMKKVGNTWLMETEREMSDKAKELNDAGFQTKLLDLTETRQGCHGVQFREAKLRGSKWPVSDYRNL